MTSETNRAVIVKIERGQDCDWLVTDSNGVLYRTFHQWMAALATEYQKAGTLVEIAFHHGWQHRDLQSIQPVKAEPSLMEICGWCRVTVKEGAEPATHTICPSCTEKMNQQMAEKYGYGWGV